MKEFEHRPLPEQVDTASGKGHKRFWKRVGLIAAGIGVSLVLIASIA